MSVYRPGAPVLPGTVGRTQRESTPIGPGGDTRAGGYDSTGDVYNIVGYSSLLLTREGPTHVIHMTHDDAENEIRSRKRRTLSVDEQVTFSHALWDNNIDPRHDGLRRDEIVDRFDLDLEYAPKTSLDHLRDIDMVEAFFPPGPENLAIAEWMGDDGEIVNGEVDEAAEEGIDGLINHIQDTDVPGEGGSPAVADGAGTTLRHVVADEFDLEPPAVEDHLRGSADQVETLNDAVGAIEESEAWDPQDDYGRINFIHTAYRYRLTPKAVRLYEQ